MVSIEVDKVSGMVADIEVDMVTNDVSNNNQGGQHSPLLPRRLLPSPSFFELKCFQDEAFVSQSLPRLAHLLSVASFFFLFQLLCRLLHLLPISMGHTHTHRPIPMGHTHTHGPIHLHPVVLVAICTCWPDLSFFTQSLEFGNQSFDAQK